MTNKRNYRKQDYQEVIKSERRGKTRDIRATRIQIRSHSVERLKTATLTDRGKEKPSKRCSKR